MDKFSDYFAKEFDYDRKPQYADSFHGQQQYCGYLFIEREWDGEGLQKYRVYGACCFTVIPISPKPIWKLEWIWLHPFFRHRGNLGKHWEFLEKECGDDFFVKKPISRDMKYFLEKGGGNHRGCL